MYFLFLGHVFLKKFSVCQLRKGELRPRIPYLIKLPEEMQCTNHVIENTASDLCNTTRADSFAGERENETKCRVNDWLTMKIRQYPLQIKYLSRYHSVIRYLLQSTLPPLP